MPTHPGLWWNIVTWRVPECFTFSRPRESPGSGVTASSRSSWPLIGRDRSRDPNTGLWLAVCALTFACYDRPVLWLDLTPRPAIMEIESRRYNGQPDLSFSKIMSLIDIFFCYSYLRKNEKRTISQKIYLILMLWLMTGVSRGLWLCVVFYNVTSLCEPVTSPLPDEPTLPPNRFPRVSSQSGPGIAGDWPIRVEQSAVP